MKLCMAPNLAPVLVPLICLGGCSNILTPSKSENTEADVSVEWQTVWLDEFEGDRLDRSKWAPEESCWGGGNNERQCYTDRTENVLVQNGILHLRAKEGTFTGPNLPEGMKGAPAGKLTQTYTSGKVRTRGLADWKYGRISARMKLPGGQGTWPAFWMMSADDTYGTWPLSGEIDIMEAINLDTPCDKCEGGIERRTSGALHFGDAIPNNTYLYLNRNAGTATSPSEDWRVYSIEWSKDAIQWFVDDDMFLRIENEDWFSAAPNAEGNPYAPFDQPFYLMINLAVGGNLAEQKNGQGFDPSAFPAELLIDWVKVGQCSGDETARACMTQTDWDGRPEGPWETQAR